jgi:hypothetical protein
MQESSCSRRELSSDTQNTQPPSQPWPTPAEMAL